MLSGNQQGNRGRRAPTSCLTQIGEEPFFSKEEKGKLSERELAEYDARVIGLFCRSVFDALGFQQRLKKDDYWPLSHAKHFNTESSVQVPAWVAAYLAERLRQVLRGSHWNQVLPTPFAPAESIFTRTGERAISVYREVTQGLATGRTVSELLREQADKRHLSYEAIRGDYYRVKGAMSDDGDLSQFLKPEPNF